MSAIQKKILIDALDAGLKEASLSLERSIQEKLIDYIEYIYKWNAVHNLTAVRDPLEMIKRHLLDSLVLLPILTKGRVLDVGTGAGLPGIPLAISQPNQTFVLLDSNQKKINFVQHVILSLKLANVSAICMRVEGYHPEEKFDWVISRAFSSLAQFIDLSGRLCKREGMLVAMKGEIAPAEIAAVPTDYTIEKIEQVVVPGLEASRSLVFISHYKTET